MEPYSIYGIAVRSLDPLPAPFCLGDRGYYCDFVLRNSPVLEQEFEVTYTHRTSDGSPWMELGIDGSRAMFHYPALADFSCERPDLSSSIVECFPHEDTGTGTIQHLFLNQVLPDLIAGSGATVVHAGAVETGDEAIAFFGKSGIGKSSLVTGFLQNGYRCLTDDVLRLEQTGGNTFLAHPSYPVLRLTREQAEALLGPDIGLTEVADYTLKCAVRMTEDQFCNESRSLKSCYFLSPVATQREVTFVELTGREAFVGAVHQTFRLNPHDEEQLSSEFQRIRSLTESIPFFRVGYPLDIAFLPKLIDAIVGHAANH